MKKELNDIGFRYIRPLKGGMKTDFDKYFSKDKKSRPPKITNNIKIKCMIKVRFANNSYIVYINYNY